MNIAFFCIVLASGMPLLLTLISKMGGSKHDTRYDNREPRAFLAGLSGWPQRANWAQQNSWEALPLFMAGILMASFAHVPQPTIDLWAIIFVLARVLYAGLYIANYASLRSLVWAVGTLASLRLMVAAL